MESAILYNIRCLSVPVVYKCRRIPSYDVKYTLTSLSSKVDREYSLTLWVMFYYPLRSGHRETPVLDPRYPVRALWMVQRSGHSLDLFTHLIMDFSRLTPIENLFFWEQEVDKFFRYFLPDIDDPGLYW